MITCNPVVFVFAMLAIVMSSVTIGSIITGLIITKQRGEKMSRYEKELFIMLSVMAVIIIVDIIIIM